ncbi:MAG: hypothetical protein KDC45_00680 [Bacteroidetes bacterium]|nr:hypothetical protein [Bacteroidota bacterium]
MNDQVLIFFNGSTDSSYAFPGNWANGLENLEQRVIDCINQSKRSIDIAAFELNSLNIVVALCKAKERGVRVRLVFDDEHAPNNNPPLWKVARSLLTTKYGIPIMSDAGWPVVNRKDKFLKGYRSLMHHKFIVIDNLSSDSHDAVVITGSYNFTITGMVSMQNVVIIRNANLARNYTVEFEKMWGGSGDLPDETKAKFHQYKPFAIFDPIDFGKSSIQVYFAPFGRSSRDQDNLLARIADIITKETEHDIRICSFSFSSGIEIDDAIREKFELHHVDVKAVFDKTSKSKYSLYAAMTGNSGSLNPWTKKADAYLANEDRQLHHKYILIDAENPDARDIPVVITGSFNFSKNANEVNDDNFLVIRDREAVNQFLQEFYARYARARKANQVEPSAEIEPTEEE